VIAALADEGIDVRNADLIVGTSAASILPMVKGIQLKQHIVEGDYVATVFDMETIMALIMCSIGFRL
jgi:hypothetical protein